MLKLKRISVVVSLLALLAGAVSFVVSGRNKLYIFNYENVLGTSMEIKISADGEENAIEAEELALTEVDRLNKIISGYDSSSEFRKWLNAGKKPVAVSRELFDVLSLFDQWRVKSNGALDASAETISEVWRDAAKQNRVPSNIEISRALRTVHQQHYILNPQSHTAQRISDAPLVLNSFAKTFIMDKAVNTALSVQGVKAVVLNIGGDIIVRGRHFEQVQVSDPKADAENDPPIARVLIGNKTIATSGNYRRGVMINGKWYSHIVNPRTGLPANEVISATVVANNATDAGALATALNVLSPKDGRNLVASVPGAEYLLVTAGGERIQSEGWVKIAMREEKQDVQNVVTTNKDKTWDPNYELAINLELATIEGMRVRRPFVAVWVVDEKKNPLRLIALWYNKPRWLNEMRYWYSTYYDKFSAGAGNISSTTSATRSPGKYTLKWDGKDDNGNYVKQGKYTMYIEVAREHGTHQLITQEIDVKKQTHFDLAGNTEVASASLDYRKKANAN
jgi:thiamine biosynthesis lipoprotein ApbE